MNSKTLLAGIIGGIAFTMVNWLIHGFVIGSVYTEHDQVFVQEQGNPLWHFLVGIVVAIAAAYLFKRTRSNWPDGLVGGACFGACVGAIVGFTNFNWPMIFDGYPYYLSWYWLAIDLVAYSVLGGVLAIFVKPDQTA